MAEDAVEREALDRMWRKGDVAKNFVSDTWVLPYSDAREILEQALEAQRKENERLRRELDKWSPQYATFESIQERLEEAQGEQ